MDISVSGTIGQKTYLKKFRGGSAPLDSPGSAYEITYTSSIENPKYWLTAKLHGDISENMCNDQFGFTQKQILNNWVAKYYLLEKNVFALRSKNAISLNASRHIVKI